MNEIELEILNNAFDKARAACDAMQSVEPSPAVAFAKAALLGAVQTAKARIESEYGAF